MAAYYLHIKHAHWLFVIITICLFNWRFWQRMAQPNAIPSKIIKIAPHVNDTLLLITGGMMAGVAKFSPFGTATWLGIKLLLVLVYIVLGAMCLRCPPRSSKALILYVFCMMTVMAIVWLAHCKLLNYCNFFANWI